MIIAWFCSSLSFPVARKNLLEGGGPKRNPQFFEELQEDLKHVEYFEFTGGEPFMIKNHFAGAKSLLQLST